MKATQPNLFPQGYAIGGAFFDREKERAALKRCIENNEHTVLVAPRRYGKTSLILQVMLENNIIGKRIDLLPATNALFVQKAIKACFTDLLNQITPKTKQAKQKLLDFIRELHPRLTLSFFGQKVEVNIEQAAETSIADLLLGLNAAATKMNKRIVLCMDEFQQVGRLNNHDSIEASIRHAVESSSHVTYVFSGSSRHLLSQMFSEKNRPLYHLCDLMVLDRIPYEDYLRILTKQANKHWLKIVGEAAIAEILNLTHCHPYYVNALCRRLWQDKRVPSAHSVQQTWLEYVQSQGNWISDDIARLTPNQRNIMAALAHQPVDEPYSNEFCQRVQIGASSVKKSLSFLIRKDFVYQDKRGVYRVLDPAIENHIHRIRNFDFLRD